MKIEDEDGDEDRVRHMVTRFSPTCRYCYRNREAQSVSALPHYRKCRLGYAIANTDSDPHYSEPTCDAPKIKIPFDSRVRLVNDTYTIRIFGKAGSCKKS